VWGFLLNFVLSHPYLRTESEKLKLEIKELNRQIDNIEKEKGEFNNRIERAQSDIRTNAHNIDGFQNAIDDIVNGKTQINIDSLKGAIGEFMGGWQNYTNGSLNTDTAKSLNDEATIAQNQWLNLKLQKLTNKTE
jgi:chromosome segregation ATPase